MSVYKTEDMDWNIQFLRMVLIAGWGSPRFRAKAGEIIKRHALSSFTPDFPANKYRTKIRNEIWEETHANERL